ncbi:MAG: DUF2334 domain-containing protein [Bacteroidaceae bacterium]|nr:DUF2334 domain-containing protein [Bacteroidaceae bacterium]
MKKYLIRLDDACPTMNKEKWDRMERLLDKYQVRPMVGVVPECKDESLAIDSFDESFWKKVCGWQQKGWAIAIHGYDHCYNSEAGMQGLNPMWGRSEFAGLSLDKQREKVRKGVTVLNKYGLNPKFFFAPSHTFDENTLNALREESDIRIVSDTIGRFPYKYKDFWFIPQIAGHCVKMPFQGIYTFCFHPNTMNDETFDRLERFMKANQDLFIGFDEIDYSLYGRKKWFDKLLSEVFFTYRKIRGLK